MTDLFRTDDLPVVDPEKDYYPELVGQDKKYVDNKAVARAVMEKDLFIERLKRETAGLRQTLSERESLENILAKIDERTKTPPVQPSPPNHGGAEGKEPAQVNPKEIEDAIFQRMQQREVEAEQKRNEETVSDRLRKAYGSDYQLRVKQEAAKLGVGTEFLSDLARKQPTAFFKLLGLDEQRVDNQMTPPPPTFRPTGNAHQEKTYSYYENIRKTKPSEYWSPRVQNEMMKQLEELGQEGFYR